MLQVQWHGRGAKTKLDQVLLLFKPDTVLKWHRDLVRRKWTFDNATSNEVGQPQVLNCKGCYCAWPGRTRSWGYSRLHGELLKLGYRIGRSTVRDILKRQHIAPAPQRAQEGR